MRKPCKWAGSTEIMWRDPKKGVRPISLCCHFFPNTPAHQDAQQPKDQFSKSWQRSWRCSDWSFLLPGNYPKLWMASAGNKSFSEPQQQRLTKLEGTREPVQPLTLIHLSLLSVVWGGDKAQQWYADDVRKREAMGEQNSEEGWVTDV